METTAINNITVSATIKAPVEKVWQFWTDPQHITQWNAASEDWHTPRAENNLQVGGKFSSRMEAKDGSFGFDFNGTYTSIKEHQEIAYVIEDGRKVQILFESKGPETLVTERFEAEQTNSAELQKDGWQAILDNFKKYVESSGKSERMHYEININAPAEKVYRTMLNKDYYNTWTTPFDPSSQYIGSWEKGAKILFTGENQAGETGGMVSRIKENIPNKFVSIEHLGMLQGDKEITSGPEVEGWAGSLENYTFTEEHNSTLLSVDVDCNQEYKSFFNETWPQALNIIKNICEA